MCRSKVIATRNALVLRAVRGGSIRLRLCAALLASLAVGGCVATGDAPSGREAGAAPALIEVDADGASQWLERLRGKPVLINVWASWCAPCRDEAPTLALAARRYSGRVHFVGVNYQDDPDAADEFARAFSLPFASLADPSGAASAALGLRGIPVTVVFDEDGRETFRRVGAITEGELVTALEAALSS